MKLTTALMIRNLTSSCRRSRRDSEKSLYAPAPRQRAQLGPNCCRGATLSFPRNLRDKHLYVCGGTGTAKSKFLEHLIRQDIKNWRKSKCGLILLDPHGSFYDNLIEWLAWNEKYIDAPIIPIDFRQDD